MMRTIFVAAAFVAMTFLCRAAEEPPPADTIIRLKVQPAPVPRPALRYQLLPELSEMHAGNPIQAYLKCFMEQDHFFNNKAALDEREKWEEMPLKDLPLDKLRDYGGITLRQADFAARLDTVDWQMLPQLQSQGIYLLLPDIQPMRGLAWALKVRFRGEIAAGRFDHALVTAKTMFALARHLGEHSTLIGNLVGVAIAGMAIGPLEEMLQQPGSPNLYWALSNLPQPLVGYRKGLQAERMLLANEFALVNDKRPMDAAQLEKAVNRFEEVLRNMTLTVGLSDGKSRNDGNQQGPRRAPTPAFRAWLDERTKDDAYLRSARRRLAAYGLAKDLLDRFPPLQVVVLDGRLAFETARDDALKGLHLPHWQAQSVLAEVAKPKDYSPFVKLAPNVAKWRAAQTRLEQRLGLLRCVEALRMYAAEHGGKLPDRLAAVKLPLPVDPYDGKEFVYELRGATATLRGTPPFGSNRQSGYNGLYEVSVGQSARNDPR